MKLRNVKTIDSFKLLLFVYPVQHELNEFFGNSTGYEQFYPHIYIHIYIFIIRSNPIHSCMIRL